MSTLVVLPEMSPKEKREYFSDFLSQCKEVREQHEGKSKILDETIAWVENYLVELEAEG